MILSIMGIFLLLRTANEKSAQEGGENNGKKTAGAQQRVANLNQNGNAAQMRGAGSNEVLFPMMLRLDAEYDEDKWSPEGELSKKASEKLAKYGGVENSNVHITHTMPGSVMIWADVPKGLRNTVDTQ